MRSRTRKKRRWIIWTALALTAVVIVVVIFVNRAKKALEALMPEYQQVEASIGDLDLTVYGSGVVEPESEETVPAPMSGSVAEWYFEIGDEVREGDILGVMDTDTNDEEIDALKVKIDELSDAIESAQDQLDSSIAYAPIDGVVKELYVQAGSDISLVNQVYGCYMRLAPDATMTITFTPSGGYANDVGDYVCLCADGYDPVMAEVVEINGPASTAEVKAYISSGTSVTVKNSTQEEEIGTGTLTGKDEVTITGKEQIAAVYVGIGQRVEKGEKLLKYDSEASGSIADKQKDLAEAEADLDELEAASPEIIATADGVLTYASDTDLRKDLTAARISPLDTMQITVAVDELDIAKIQEGQTATVSVDALPDAEYTGTVSRISQIGQAAGGVTTYDVTLTIGATEGLRIGMNASAEILVDSRKDVVILPLEAIQYQGDKPYVLLAGTQGGAPQDQQSLMNQYGVSSQEELQEKIQDMTDEERQAFMKDAMRAASTDSQGTATFVEVGLMNEQYAEIISGVNAGDAVLMPVSTSNSSFNGMMGGPVVVTETRSGNAGGGRYQGR